jgi:hypothetical protein
MGRQRREQRTAIDEEGPSRERISVERAMGRQRMEQRTAIDEDASSPEGITDGSALIPRPSSRCWLELLLHIPRIFKLGNRFLTQGYTCQPVSADDFTQYADIQSRVQAWTPASSVRAEVALTGRIFQSAILLYLYTTLNPLATGGITRPILHGSVPVFSHIFSNRIEVCRIFPSPMVVNMVLRRDLKRFRRV